MLTPLKFSGMNNKNRDEALPKDKLRNAVNVIFDADGSIRFPRPGKTLQYAGDCHSLLEKPVATLFVEGGSLKKLNADNSATTLKTGLGSERCYYATVADTVYFSNGSITGKVRNGVASEWGTQRPPRNPDCTAVTFGGLFAGDYRVCITWIADEESGAGMGQRVTVASGGGIHLTNFPAPPSYVTGVAVYVSSVNGKSMYLYGEYPRDITELTIDSNIATVLLTTQFHYPPSPQGPVFYHHGRIYYPRGNRLYYTLPRRYGLQKANSYLTFDSTIQTVNSCPNVLYVGTLNKFGRVINIDSDDNSPPVFQPLQDTGTVKGTECTDPEGGVSSYVMSNRGILKCTQEGIQELTYEQCAIPYFKKGVMTVIEYNGLKHLVGVFQEGTQNPLANQQVNIAELARGSL